MLLYSRINFKYLIVIEVKPLQTEIFDKMPQAEELQALLKIKTKKLESLQERKSWMSFSEIIELHYLFDYYRSEVTTEKH